METRYTLRFRRAGSRRFLKQLQEVAVGIAQDDGALFTLRSGDFYGHPAGGDDRRVSLLRIGDQGVDIAHIEDEAGCAGVGVLRLGALALESFEMGELETQAAGQ